MTPRWRRTWEWDVVIDEWSLVYEALGQTGEQARMALQNSMPADFVSRLTAAYLDDGAVPSLTQYGWILAG